MKPKDGNLWQLQQLLWVAIKTSLNRIVGQLFAELISKPLWIQKRSENQLWVHIAYRCKAFFAIFAVFWDKQQTTGMWEQWAAKHHATDAGELPCVMDGGEKVICKETYLPRWWRVHLCWFSQKCLPVRNHKRAELTVTPWLVSREG